MSEWPIKLKEDHAAVLKQLFLLWNSLDFMKCPFSDELDKFNCKLREWMREEAKKENA